MVTVAICWIAASYVLGIGGGARSVALLATVLALRGPRPTISPAYLRLAAMVAGPLFLYSALAAFGGGHHH
ncbi:MAG: hypothetical protein QOJ89_1000 [bacterium]|jgi:hypothetical protein